MTKVSVVAAQVEACLAELSPEDRRMCNWMAQALMDNVHNLGRKGSLELLARLAVYLDEPRCRLCGAPVEDAYKQICKGCYMFERYG